MLRRPASTIKLLTVLTAEAHLPADAKVPVSAYAAAMPALRMGLLPGELWPLSQLVTSTVIVSANDAAVAIAEASGGSLDGFETQMEAMARTLGMVDSPRLTDPAGLDDNVFHGAGDFISAWDLALVGRAALADPAIVEAAKTPIVRVHRPAGQGPPAREPQRAAGQVPRGHGPEDGVHVGGRAHAGGHGHPRTAARSWPWPSNAPDLYGSVTDLLNLGFAIPSPRRRAVALVAPDRGGRVDGRRLPR